MQTVEMWRIEDGLYIIALQEWVGFLLGLGFSLTPPDPKPPIEG